MFRKVVLTLAVGAGLLGTSELSPAQAAWGHYYHHPVIIRPAIVVRPLPCCSYTLYYRSCCNEPWRVYRTYGEEQFALDAQARLRFGGFEVMIGR
jgi:hypothetical protein